MDDTFNLEKFEKMLEKFFPVLYYATDSNLERGNLYRIKEGDFNPEFIVCHPDDFDKVKRMITTRRLVHIKDEPPEEGLRRLIATLRKKYPDPSPFTWDDLKKT
jgi:hypothetical protein